VDLPDAGAAAATWPAGFYGVSVVVTSGGDTRTTNELPLSLAPTIDSISPNPAARDGSGAVTLTVAFAPDLQPRQRAALLLGSSEATLDAVTAPSGSATVTVPSVPAGDQFVRLRVDGVDTLLVDRSVDPPVFDPSQKVTIT
jgi:hypothetical protein